MADFNEQSRLVDLHRRKTMLSGAALFSLFSSTGASFADGGRDIFSKIEIIYEDDEGDDDTPTKIYTQNAFGRFSQKTIKSLYYANESNKINFRLRGFSPGFAPTILRIGYNDRARTRLLLRSMSRIKPENSRKERLNTELSLGYKLEKDLKISVRYLRAQKSPDLDAERLSLKHAKGYRMGVRSWLRRPLEGSY
jgi:hypothetical protein